MKDGLNVKDVVNDENSPAEGNKGGVSTKTSEAALLKEAAAAASPAATEELTSADAAAAEEPPTPQLSPEIREKMAKNKMAAKLKLLSTKTNGLVTDFGASWLSTLEPEFSKDYFLKLSRFVAAGKRRMGNYKAHVCIKLQVLQACYDVSSVHRIGFTDGIRQLVSAGPQPLI